jgi:hypothetical protein
MPAAATQRGVPPFIDLQYLGLFSPVSSVHLSVHGVFESHVTCEHVVGLAAAQAGSALSISPLQSSSIPLLQFSFGISLLNFHPDG